MMTMIRVFAAGLLMSATLIADDQPAPAKLAALPGWGGETIALPPGFAPDMALKGVEHIRFAPGMMQPTSDSFFSYAFVFELETKPVLTDKVVTAEFLKYFRGLCKAVLNGKRPDVDPAKFTLDVRRVKSVAATPSIDSVPVSNAPGDQAVDTTTRYLGILNWVEPFATQKPQRLNLEIWTWTAAEQNFVFACVSPRPPDAAIWLQLHAIRDTYLMNQVKAAAEPTTPDN